jgi:hypothetical protein
VVEFGQRQEGIRSGAAVAALPQHNRRTEMKKLLATAAAVVAAAIAMVTTSQAAVIDCSSSTHAECIAKVQQAGGADGRTFCDDPRETLTGLPYKNLLIICPGAPPSMIEQAKSLDKPSEQTCIQYRDYITCAKSEAEFQDRKAEIDKKYADEAEKVAREKAVREQAARDEAADDGFKLPRCGSEQAKATLANVVRTDARDLLEVKTTDSNTKQRWCYAYFIAPYPGLGGSFREAVYTLEWIDEASGRYWLQIRAEQRAMPKCSVLPNHPACAR